MVCVNKTLDQMLEEIGNPHKIRSDTIVPSDYLLDSSLQDSYTQYADRYRWLGRYETELASFLRTLDLPVNISLGVRGHMDNMGYLGTCGEWDPLSLAFENAFGRGHNYNYALPINLEIYLGDKGIIFTVTDSGTGFDFWEIVQKKRKGQTYFRTGGYGFFIYDLPFDDNDNIPFEVSKEGNSIIIMYSFQPRKSPFVDIIHKADVMNHVPWPMEIQSYSGDDSGIPKVTM